MFRHLLVGESEADSGSVDRAKALQPDDLIGEWLVDALERPEFARLV